MQGTILVLENVYRKFILDNIRDKIYTWFDPL